MDRLVCELIDMVKKEKLTFEYTDFWHDKVCLGFVFVFVVIGKKRRCEASGRVWIEDGEAWS